jgi:hypothetical protein
MRPQNAPVCIVCFRKLEGPLATPVTTARKLAPGERWQPCSLCQGPCDAVPGIYLRLYLATPPEAA